MAKRRGAYASSYFFCFCVLLLLFFMPVHAAVSGDDKAVEAVFIFGDSTFDVGTNNFLNESIFKANFRYNGIDYPYSVPTGRFSNGYNSADQIVRLLGYKRSPPSYFSLANAASSFKKRILGGVNFASGGSGILDSTGNTTFKSVVTLGEQIQQFSTVRESITSLEGEEKTANLLSQSLFLISVGSNDMFDYQRRVANKTTNMTGQELLITLQQTFQAHIQNLYELGARKFGIVSIPPIGCCPFERFQANSTDCVGELNDLAQAFFNVTETLLQEISSQVEGMIYSLGNAFEMTYDIIDNPLAFGFKEVKKACCGRGEFNGGGPCNASTADLCDNHQDHLFWDWFHPTEAASRLAALTFFGGEHRYVTPMNFSQLVLTN